jgi:phosphotransferase system IIB component
MLNILFDFNEFNTNYWWIYLVIVGIISLSFLFFLIFKNKNRKENITKNYSETLNYLGGEENLISHELKGTRLILVLKDYKQVDREKLKDLGVEKVLSMSNKYILVGKVENIKKIEESLK